MTYKTIALQNRAEFEAFAGILKFHRCASYLEIGSWYGGSLWLAAQALTPSARIVSVDVPSNPHLASLDTCLRELRSMGHSARLVLGDSRNPETIATVQAMGIFDAVFIDGNHALDYVKSDWENYGPLARKVVAFHDISWKERAGATPIKVPEFWQWLKPQYAHVEIAQQPRDMGIGVIFKEEPRR